MRKSVGRRDALAGGRQEALATRRERTPAPPEARGAHPRSRPRGGTRRPRRARASRRVRRRTSPPAGPLGAARERPRASIEKGTVASFAGRSSGSPGAAVRARRVRARAARRRGARASAAKAREEAEKRREVEAEKVEKAAKARRAAAEKKRVEVAFGRRARANGEREAVSARKKPPEPPPFARPRATEVKPFKLSTGNHTRNKEELRQRDRENRRDPTWEPRPRPPDVGVEGGRGGGARAVRAGAPDGAGAEAAGAAEDGRLERKTKRTCRV